MKKVLVTGANGFIGRSLINEGARRGFFVLSAVRNLVKVNDIHLDLSSDFNCKEALNDIDTIVHCAGIAHAKLNDCNIYNDINCEATIKLAQQAETAGVKRFIFLSSIKVNGENTSPVQGFDESISQPPEDFYALSKYNAEIKLLEFSKSSQMDIVIIRPPLVYGPDVRANFLSLMKCMGNRYPLPLGSISNKRSMIFIDNLVDFVFECVVNNSASNQVFVISDDELISTTDLLIKLSELCHVSHRLIPVPISILNVLGFCLRKREMIDKLTGSLVVDINKAKTLLNWKPPFSLDEGLTKTVDAFLLKNKNNKY